MVSKYLKRLLFKEWLPITITFTLVATFIFVIYLSTFDLYGNNYILNDAIYVESISIPFSIFAISMPFFVYNYRFSLKSSDTYAQLPFEPKQMRNTRVFAGLIAVCSGIIISFLIGFVFFTVRYYASPLTYKPLVMDEVIVRNKGIYNPFGLLVGLPILLVSIGLEYFITCFMISFTGKSKSAVILVLLAHSMLAYFIPSFLTYIMTKFDYASGTFAYLGEMNGAFSAYSPGYMFTVNIADYFVTNLAWNSNGFPAMSNASLIGFALAVGVEVIIGSLSVTMVLLKDDPSGEYSGNNGLIYPKFNWITYLTVIPLFLLLSSSIAKTIYLYLIVDVLIVAFYYFLNVTFVGSFKMKKYNYFILGGMFILFIIAYFM